MAYMESTKLEPRTMSNRPDTLSSSSGLISSADYNDLAESDLGMNVYRVWSGKGP